jgi:hypothetical protein
VAAEAQVAAVDPFELPDWLGTQPVTWIALSSVHDSHLVEGELIAGAESAACDLLAADQAFPRPVLHDDWRRLVHQAWTHGQVLLLSYDGRLTVAVPGTCFTADRVLEAIGRLAKAVGVAPTRFAATLRL